MSVQSNFFEWQTVKKTFVDGKDHAEILFKRYGIFGMTVNSILLMDKELFERVGKEMGWFPKENQVAKITIYDESNCCDDKFGCGCQKTEVLEGKKSCCKEN